MTTISSKYLGELRTESTHLKSNTVIITDAPIDNHGKGESFSPSDLVCSALGSCMMTIMGIAANTHQINLDSMKIDITKFMTVELPRKIAKIKIEFDFDHIQYSEKEKQILKNSAHTCPVALSLHPDIVQEIIFNF